MCALQSPHAHHAGQRIDPPAAAPKHSLAAAHEKHAHTWEPTSSSPWWSSPAVRRIHVGHSAGQKQQGGGGPGSLRRPCTLLQL